MPSLAKSELLAMIPGEILHFADPLIPAATLTLPQPNFVAEVFDQSDRSEQVLANLKTLFDAGRLGGTGYLSILPIDQGIEHTAGAEFATHLEMFDPLHIARLAIEGGCSALATSYGVASLISRTAKTNGLPLILKLNHNELLTKPVKHDQTMVASVEQAVELGAVGVGATIYFGSTESSRQWAEVAAAFAEAHRKGLFTIAWCYLRNDEFTHGEVSYEAAADMTAQANYLAASIGADIVKQKLPTTANGFKALDHSFWNEAMYQSVGESVIDWTRYQVLNGFAGKIGLLSSGGAAAKTDDSNERGFEADLRASVTAAAINKRAGGMGLIAGRKVFSHPIEQGIQILHAIQDVYLSEEVTVA